MVETHGFFNRGLLKLRDPDKALPGYGDAYLHCRQWEFLTHLDRSRNADRPRCETVKPLAPFLSDFYPAFPGNYLRQPFSVPERGITMTYSKYMVLLLAHRPQMSV
uniref:Uncharacterized protein n=1 Tax=Sphaerodactylus townsendi TaxID=933632 RepID=A0ACB8E6T3_9SAUR